MGDTKENNVKLSKQDEADAELYLKELDDKKGELEHGPVMNRSCSDIICCLLFFVFVLGYVAASGYGWLYGDPSKLLISWDSDQRGCGLEGQPTADYPFLYWPEAPSDTIITEVKDGNFDKVTELLNSGVCVKTCPKDTGVIECLSTSGMKANTGYTNAAGATGCEFMINENFLASLNINLAEYKNLGIDTSGVSFPFRYNTKAMGGFCIPEVDKGLGLLKEVGNSLLETFYEDIAGETGVKAIGDIVVAWHVIAASAVTALILGYLFLFVIRCIGGAIIYLFLILIEAALIVGGFYLMNYAETFPPED
jgi:choline transporter-like protein 2/4/5